jgi:hypothetical protein
MLLTIEQQNIFCIILNEYNNYEMKKRIGEKCFLSSYLEYIVNNVNEKYKKEAQNYFGKVRNLIINGEEFQDCTELILGGNICCMQKLIHLLFIQKIIMDHFSDNSLSYKIINIINLKLNDVVFVEKLLKNKLYIYNVSQYYDKYSLINHIKVYLKKYFLCCFY